MSVFPLKAKKRDLDKLSSKKLKIEGEIPAIYYHKNSTAIPLRIGQKEINALLHSPRGLVRLTLDNNETLLAVAKEVQREPVSHRPIHLTFEGIKEGETFHISLPVKLEHTENCEWFKAKGMAVLKLAHMNIEVLPKEMPDAIHIDINNLKIGQTLHVSDLKIPGLKFLDNPHTEVVSITYKTAAAEEPAPEKPAATGTAAGGAAGAGGEKKPAAAAGGGKGAH